LHHLLLRKVFHVPQPLLPPPPCLEPSARPTSPALPGALGPVAAAGSLSAFWNWAQPRREGKTLIDPADVASIRLLGHRDPFDRLIEL